ncbi:uncharacterized protein SAZU_7495 [Streptomyces azureus]|uniref:Uncharacterized protein n=1 Tax=Streptomyces azureus TaxID=146537 RepID=A0A0K8PY30_STRAJ|nr:uncharacterized protein SAZU_7495 [Streptomyces azureus]
MSLSVAMRSLSVYLGLLTDERTGSGIGLIDKVSPGGCCTGAPRPLPPHLSSSGTCGKGDVIAVDMPPAVVRVPRTDAKRSSGTAGAQRV